ncbi:hypothetical protein SARC_10349 [Sphaeroforma arctica JP610]|uniref:Uncharacterized protein n=1 Tax=Sphaeroforma arctica JP610 TaxID=667725 RepID=A0A0L0FKA5_9EUKA|nr:hypothetical protein SARC_10349 [Sphaeroforma arctica JP610]KNC77185.1 hypothetical protein SARC_10349 [Sphaeroforma arctica JP610]|eukprot:XP_014151087.1 hypothetical protein SARC_10349 [Sphaeroforma arctica JP610]
MTIKTSVIGSVAPIIGSATSIAPSQGVGNVLYLSYLDKCDDKLVILRAKVEAWLVVGIIEPIGKTEWYSAPYLGIKKSEARDTLCKNTCDYGTSNTALASQTSLMVLMFLKVDDVDVRWRAFLTTFWLRDLKNEADEKRKDKAVDDRGMKNEADEKRRDKAADDRGMKNKADEKHKDTAQTTEA